MFMPSSFKFLVAPNSHVLIFYAFKLHIFVCSLFMIFFSKSVNLSTSRHGLVNFSPKNGTVPSAAKKLLQLTHMQQTSR